MKAVITTGGSGAYLELTAETLSDAAQLVSISTGIYMATRPHLGGLHVRYVPSLPAQTCESIFLRINLEEQKPAVIDAETRAAIDAPA